jgi:hypothetical protein
LRTIGGPVETWFSAIVTPPIRRTFNGEVCRRGLATLQLFGLSTKVYVAVYSLVANLLVVFVGSALARFFVSQEQTSYGMLAEEETREPEGA